VRAALLLTLVASSAIADGDGQRSPRFPVSIANPKRPEVVRDGTNFNKIKTALANDSGAGLSDLLTNNSKLYLSSKKMDFVGPTEIMKAVKTIMSNCIGPYSIDEGRAVSKVGDEWAQTSWVCHINEGSAARAFFEFRDSPEIDLEFNFKDGKVTLIYVSELIPLPVPGYKLLPMDAAEHLKATF